MNPRRIPWRSARALLLLIAVGGAVTSAVAGNAGTATDVGPPAADGPNASFADQATVEGFDDVEVVVSVGADRSAQWRVKYRYRLADGAATAAFEHARRNVSDPPGVFIERMRAAARRSERRTGRAMAIQNGSVATFTSVPHGRFGVVQYRFTWTGFAAADDGRLVAGDVIGGYPLGANESLVFGWDEQFRVAEVTPPPNATRESTVRWEGPHDFGVQQPRLVLARATEGGLSSALTRPLVLAGIVGALAVVAVAVAFRAGVGRTAAAFVRQRGEPAGGTAATDESEGAAPPEALLSDEERVLALLEDNGGRMKQQDVKESLGWSRTKTSNVVNDLQDAGKVEVYRLGRENTLALPGEMDV
jgi:hypothetical protein